MGQHGIIVREALTASLRRGDSLPLLCFIITVYIIVNSYNRKSGQPHT